MKDNVSALPEQANNGVARELKESNVSVNSRLLNRSYNPAMLEMIASNNPGACSYDKGALTMNGLAYLLFSEGLSGAKNKIEAIKKLNVEKCEGGVSEREKSAGEKEAK